MEREKDMVSKIGIGVGAACLGISSVAMADLITVEFDMTDTTVEQGGFVYGSVMEGNAYAGYDIVGIGISDLVVDFLDGGDITFSWAMNIPGYGTGIWTWASDTQAPGTQQTYNFESASPASYAAVVADADAWGSWNMGTFVGSNGVDNGLTVVSGTMYYILDGAPIPTPGVLAIFAVAGLGSRRRRR